VKRGWSVLSAVLFLLLAACGRQAAAPKIESLRIGFLHDPLAALLYVAQEQGLFQRHALEVSFRGYEGGAYAINDLRRGEIEVAVATEFAFLMQSFKGNDLRALGTLATANNSEVIARTDRGIRRPEDLRGRRLGVSKGMNTEFLLGAFLAFNGLRPRDVQLVDLRPSGLVRALAQGEVDAVCLYPPFSYSAKDALGGEVLSWSAQGGQEYFFLLTTTEKLLGARPNALKALLAALLEAEAYLTQNNSAARAILARSSSFPPGNWPAVSPTALPGRPASGPADHDGGRAHGQWPMGWRNLAGPESLPVAEPGSAGKPQTRGRRSHPLSGP
jgi:NitT/TauT family transport system substrate-binding protein